MEIRPRTGWLIGAGAAVVVALGFAAMLTPSLESIRGLSQRLAEAGLFVGISGVSMFLLRERVA
jgi:predicted cobalt transporter CbtA